MCSIQNSQLLNFDLPLSFFIRPWNPIIASPSTSLASALVNSNASQDKLNYTNLSIYRLFWTPLTYLNKKRLSLSQTIIITIIYLNHLPITSLSSTCTLSVIQLSIHTLPPAQTQLSHPNRNKPTSWYKTSPRKALHLQYGCCRLLHPKRLPRHR